MRGGKPPTRASDTATGNGGSRIPSGYESVLEAAGRSGTNAEVLKRKCRSGEIPGARKIPWRGGGLWVVPEGASIPPDRRRRLSEKKAREVARRAHARENKAALAREFRITRPHVYQLMRRFPSGGGKDGSAASVQ